MSGEPIELYDPDRAAAIGLIEPVLFLSAGVPYVRTEGTQAQLRRNPQYLPPRRAQIRAAVVQLARFAFVRGVRLVFGGHPAIGSLVLEVTRAVPSTGVPRVFVFQSAYFEHLLPIETLELGHWDDGKLLWTRSVGPAQVPGSQGDPGVRAASLLLMRQTMVTVSGLIGAVFIGGMDGVEEEASLWRAHQPRLPCYALPATGSAAKCLFDGNPSAFAGHLSDPFVLDTPAITRAVASIFEDLQLP